MKPPRAASLSLPLPSLCRLCFLYQVTSILLETAGMIVFGVIVETLSSLIKSGKLGEQVLREKMDMLREFFRMRDITVSTRRKVRLFYENMYKHRSVWDESEILKPLPAVLQKELVRDM